MVQIASEALGTITNERELYKTVLVLTLELLDASGGAVLVEGEDVVSFGLNDSGETLAALETVRIKGRVPWVGRLGQHHALGVGFGRADGAVFLVREERPYTEAECASLRLVARQLARAQERSRLYASLEKTTLEAISALAAALESRDGTTGGHIRRTQVLAGEVARTMGLSSEEVRTAQYAVVLHDIGKIGIPDSILNKLARLTEEEWEIMRRHPKMGADIVGEISGFDSVTGAVLSHHERYDGLGYPERLTGADIPVGARLISAIDAYDAMTNDRPYRKALTRQEAMAELEANSGSQFDPTVIEALTTVLLKREEHEPEREKEPGQ
ncbi:MAG: Response regulator [uncultured Rubrobacteraceae bacterium]|uniref:Response regulator n=1 Tax=uncultured Rubrobacteraceae bacterium TaxID=349277 RepID=A0A6J4PZ92_9ACTN|nr:MAG: Response regulator [uncultured Rubrobacteraceae bacterium]